MLPLARSRAFGALTFILSLASVAVPAFADPNGETAATDAMGPTQSARDPRATAPIAFDYHARAALANDGDATLVLASLNAHRAERGLEPLCIEPRLTQIAVAYARTMLERHFFGHYTPEGEGTFQRFKVARYTYMYAGENLAFDRNASSAAEALWNSPAHRENILEPHYAKVGIAAVPTAMGELVVEDFSD